MFRIILIMIITSIPFLNCSNTSSGKVPTGFITQDFSLKTPLSNNKSYSFTNGSGINESCAASTRCSAVYYNGAVENITYTSFAADARMSGNSSNFNIMVYKTSSDPNYTVKVLYNNVLYTSTSVDPSNMTITDNGDNTYTLTFTGAVSLGAVSIGTGDYIVAQSQN